MTEKQPIDLTAGPIGVAWDQTLQERTTVPTLQVVVNPKLRRGSPIHDRAFAELARLGADYVRFVPWFPYPHDAIAELYPPENGKTSWNFTSIDPFTIDFLEATQGHPVVLNFSTIPPWMFKADHMVPYPADPDQPIWHYQVGEELRDPSLKEMSEYFARLVSWYTNGGFTDELGARHESGHRYKVDYWEVLNEPDFEHNTGPEPYTRRYDAIVAAIRRDNPGMKFIGISAALPSKNPQFFEHFLNPANHQPGIPLDMISYHFYGSPGPDESLETQQHTLFAQADAFINTVRYIETIRKRLSPTTQTTVNELGVIRADDGLQFMPGHTAEPIPPVFWNLSGAIYAYVFAHLAELGIEVAGESQLVGYPSQFPSVTMVDWETGAPNARFRVLELLKTRLSPQDHVVASIPFGPFGASLPFLHFQGFRGAGGRRKLLLVSKRDRPIDLTLPGFSGATAAIVDQATAGGPIREETLASEQFRLPGFGVAVITL